MKHLLTSLALAVGACAPALAQTEATFTQYTVQPTLLNPALAGVEDLHQVRLNYRSAWSGLPESPSTYAINYNGPVGESFGLGAQVAAEQVGRTQRYDVRLQYAFHQRAGDFTVATGFSTAFSTFALNASATEGFGFDADDPVVQNALDGRTSFDASFGVHARYRDVTYVGLAFPSLISARLNEVAEGGDDAKGGLDNFILRVGQDHRFRQRSFKFSPSVVISRIYGAPFRVDVNAVASFLDETFVAGLGYRAGAGNDVALMLGTKWDKLRFFYSYDMNFGDFQRFNAGSHELTLGFDFLRAGDEADNARYN